MTSFNHIRFEDGTELSLAEWLGQAVHSVMEFAATAGVSNLRAFNYVRGQRVSSIGLPARNATEQDTNLVKAQNMNQDEALLCFAITFELFGITPITFTTGQEPVVTHTVAPTPLLSGTDLRRLQRDAVFELYVGAGLKKPQFDAPFVYYGQSPGALINSSGDAGDAATTALNTDYGTQGEIRGTNQHMLDLPIYIGGFGDQAHPGNSMTFYTKFYNANQGGVFSGLRQSVRIHVELDGLKKRPA